LVCYDDGMPHIHEKYDFVVNAFIVFHDKVLLVHHPRYDKWLPMGGHVELNEDPEEALIREIQEETGLDVEILSTKPRINEPEVKLLYVPNYIDVHDANAPHKHIALNYFAKAKNGNHVKSAEHDQIKWFSSNELDDPKYNLSGHVKFISKEAIKLAQNT
jgi:8-oxo-dGTP pyrophosphatase MutT (NUDIX family)